MKEFAFQIGEDREYIIESETELEAFKLLADKYWEYIDKAEYVMLLGELTDKQKLLDLK